MPERAPIGAIVLAAGQASRFRAGDASLATKAVALLDGEPLVRHVAQAALAAGAQPVIVVTGFGQADVARALDGLAVRFAHNPDYASGLASSLRRGVAALPGDCAGAFALLADMPRVGPDLLARLMDALRANPEACAVVPVHRGAWGNPALLGRSLFPAVARLEGDEGARRLLKGRPDVVEVPVDDESVALDVDTSDALAALQRR